MPVFVPTNAELLAALDVLAARVSALEARTPGAPPAPAEPKLAAPTGLAATADPAGRTITLRWDPVPGAESYTIYELTSEVGRAGFPGMLATTAIRGPLGDPREYRWQVAAVRSGVESPRTPVVAVTLTAAGTPTAPPRPPPGPGAGRDLVASVPFDTPAMAGLRTGDSGIRQWTDGGPNTFQVVDHLGAWWGRAQITGGPHPADIRAEGIVATPGNNTLKLREGDEYWFGDTIVIGTGFPDRFFNNVLQWKNDGTGSAPLFFGAWDGQLQLRSAIGNRACGPIDFGRPHRYVIGIRFGSNNSGWIECHRDGAQTLPRVATSTLHVGKESYPKIGYYRGDEIVGTGQVFHRDYRVGRTRDSVT